VRRSNSGSGDTSPRNIKPCFGQVFEDLSKVSRGDKSGDVFEEDPSRSDLTDDPDGVGPHVALVVGSSSRPGGAKRLTGESGRDDIHAATPWRTIEGSNVIPDRTAFENAVFLALHEDLSAIRILFNRAHDAVSEDPAREKASTSTSE